MGKNNSHSRNLLADKRRTIVCRLLRIILVFRNGKRMLIELKRRAFGGNAMKIFWFSIKPIWTFCERENSVPSCNKSPTFELFEPDGYNGRSFFNIFLHSSLPMPNQDKYKSEHRRLWNVKEMKDHSKKTAPLFKCYWSTQFKWRLSVIGFIRPWNGFSN